MIRYLLVILFIQFLLFAEIVSDKNGCQLRRIDQPVYIKATATVGQDNGQDNDVVFNTNCTTSEPDVWKSLKLIQFHLEIFVQS